MKWSRPAALALVFVHAAAASAVSISATPVILQADVAAGASDERTVTISSQAMESLTFEVEAYDLGLDEAGNQARFPAGTLPESMAAWLTVQPPAFVLRPGQEFDVSVVLSVPADATGGHQAALVFRTIASVAEPEGPAVRVGAAIAIKIFQATEGRVERALELVESDVRPPTPFDRAEVRLLVKNIGDAYLRAYAETAILDDERNLVGKGASDPTGFVLPGQSALLTVSWDGELSAGNYNALTTLVYHDGSLVVDDTFSVEAEPD